MIVPECSLSHPPLSMNSVDFLSATPAEGAGQTILPLVYVSAADKHTQFALQGKLPTSRANLV